MAKSGFRFRGSVICSFVSKSGYENDYERGTGKRYRDNRNIPANRVACGQKKGKGGSQTWKQRRGE